MPQTQMAPHASLSTGAELRRVNHICHESALLDGLLLVASAMRALSEDLLRHTPSPTVLMLRLPS